MLSQVENTNLIMGRFIPLPAKKILYFGERPISNWDHILFVFIDFGGARKVPTPHLPNPPLHLHPPADVG